MALPTHNIPPIGPKQGKVWGHTQLVFAHNSTETHTIGGIAGHKCSRHSHKHKWNRFVVLHGKMIVRQYHDNGFVDETSLTKHQTTDVPPGVQHEFEVLEDCMAIEIYWVTLDAQDIERFSTGGKVDEKLRSADTNIHGQKVLPI